MQPLRMTRMASLGSSLSFDPIPPPPRPYFRLCSHSPIMFNMFVPPLIYLAYDGPISVERLSVIFPPSSVQLA